MACPKVDTSNYVRCHEAIQLVCHQAASLVDNVLQAWHSRKKQTIQPCSRPKPRPLNQQECAEVGKPKPTSSCQNCVAWGAAVDAEYYPQSSKGSIPWGNINPTFFSRSYMEVAKAFVLRLPKTQIFAKATDFDSASLLMLMMHFAEFHNSDHASYEVIKEVSSIRNTLSHLKLKDNLHLSDQLLKTYFDKIHDLVSCLERLHSRQFTKTEADDVRCNLTKILQSPVTVIMMEEALCPLTDGMKDIIFKTMEDQFRQQLQELQAHSLGLMKTVEQQIGKQTQGIERVVADGFQRTTDRLSQQMQDLKDHMDEQTTAFAKDQGLMKQVEEQIGKHTQGIERAVAGGFQGTAEVLSERLSQEMQDLKNVMDQERLDQEEIQTWKRRLKVKYTRERKDIRFGKSRHSIADMDKIFVDLELLQDDIESSMEGDEPSSKCEECSSSNEYEIGVSSKQRGKCRKLNSYQDLLTLVDEHKQPLHHILVRGNAGCGKTTLMSRIAYEWSKTVEPSETSIPGSHTPHPIALTLVLVLDARKFKMEQTLSQAIEKQLLPGVSIDIDKVLSSLGNKCLILIDGYDELPKGIEDHALDSPQLSECFVIVTTRPHKVDEFCVFHKGYVHVKVSGFSQEKSFQYVRKFFQNAKQPELAETLTKKISGKPILTILSSFPILLVMMCLLWKHLPKKAVCFQSMTRLYHKAMKYLNKPFENKSEVTIDHILCMLGEPALKGLFENNLLISSDDFADKELLNQAFEIGLAFEEEGELVDAASVTFIHKTFQEYCAAIYLTSLFSKDREKFDYHLNCINQFNVDEMEYLLRFGCGVNVEAGEAILSHVFKLYGNMYFNQLKRPIILLYERKLSTNTDPSPELLDTYLKELGKYKTLTICDDEMLAAISHFAVETDAIAKVMFSNIKAIKNDYGYDDISTMIKILHCLPSLEELTLSVELLIGDLSDKDTLPLIKSLKEFTIIGMGREDRYTLSVVQLARILGYMPSLICVTLQYVYLKGRLVENLLHLGKSLKDFCMKGHQGVLGDFTSVSMVTLVSLLSCMQSLANVELNGIELINDLDQRTPQLIKSLKIFTVVYPPFIYNVSVVDLARFLRCMPSLEKITIKGTRLKGKLSEDAPLLSTTLNDLHVENIFGVPTTVVTLMSFIRCMPSLAKLSLCGLIVTGNLVECPRLQSTSLREFKFGPGYTLCVVDVVWLAYFLGLMPSLLRVELLRVSLQGKLVENTVFTSKSMKHFIMDCDMLGVKFLDVNVVPLASFLKCMPSLETIRLKNIHLSGKLAENIPLLSDSLTEFSVNQDRGSNPFGMSDLNVVSLMSFLRRMPSLQKVTFLNVSLTDEVDKTTPQLNASLQDIRMEGESDLKPSVVSVVTLHSFLRCMPSLARVKFQNINLSNGLIEFKGYTGTVVTLVILLKYIQLFKKGEIGPVCLTGESNEFTVTLIKSRKYSPQEIMKTVYLLFKLLQCMPLYSKVTLKDFNLND